MARFTKGRPQLLGTLAHGKKWLAPLEVASRRYNAYLLKSGWHLSPGFTPPKSVL
jgi:hypothetical protein